MSIPPLVCSTPPPPDQCEDDKEPEDFGFQYNLSQEEDDDYDFGNFSTYTQYQATKTKNAPSTTKTPIENKEVTTNLPPNEIDDIQAPDSPAFVIGELKTKLKLEDELNVEDLNLELIEKETETQGPAITKIDTKDDVVDSLTNIPSGEGSKETPTVETKELSTLGEDYIDQSTILNNNNEPKPFIDPKIETADLKLESDAVVTEVNKLDNDSNQDDQVEDISISLEAKIDDNDIQFTEFKSNETNENIPTVSTTEIEETIKTEDDDDFGDFEDFQVNTNVAIAIDTVNPWENNETGDNDNFGEFKANFSEENDLFKSEVEIHSKEDCNIQSETINDDDDFGDFDDFQSSSAKVQEELQSQIPVLNLQASESESQILETIDKVISSIFEDEIEEPKDEISTKLESCLGVTWGHLLETDERQPYMVQWNNSSAQKMLLKALCIDSRNILFGPKWSYNTPKYAANLSVAPLQPQKQTVTSSAAPAVTAKETSSSKSGNWTDPFTADSQESSNPETGNEAAALPIGPTDLDVFEASSSSKQDKIYSNTINIQPIRHISLPDTHIFTPTDSETPRSQTIHYDNNPPLHLPQTSIDIKSPDSVPVKNVKDDDYWEFQDYKGTKNNEPVPSTSKQTFEKPEVKESIASPVTYATQVLQPVKVEPIMPTLNWPDPGEVKETFDDFSSFVSNTSWNKDQQETRITTPIQDKIETNKPTISAVSKTEVTASDDDFDTFQSALPVDSKPSLNTVQPFVAPPTISKSQSSISNTIPQNFGSFENALPKIDTMLPNSTTSLPSKVKDLTSLSAAFVPTNSENISKNKELTKPVLPTPASNPVLPTPSNNSIGLTLLQPIPASSLRNQSKTTQILQPLSLESYSQINWPNPGIDLQDLSRFNPVNTLQNLKSDLDAHGAGSPVHSQKGGSQSADDDWGEFVSSRPKPQPAPPKKPPVPLDDDEWTDFISSPVVKPNGLNTISLNVHTNLTSQKTNPKKVATKTRPLEIPSLNYVTPKSSQKTYNDRHFQNL